MTLSAIPFSTEGPVLLIGSTSCARLWNGREDDGSGLIVSYWGQGLETLPKEIAQTKKKGGRRTRKVATAAEAAELEARLLGHFLQLHPRAARPAKYPDYPVWYVGETRVFGIERVFTSALDSVMKKLKNDVASITFDKSHKASALFLATEGATNGVIAVNKRSGAFAVTEIRTAQKDALADVMRALDTTSPEQLEPDGTVTFTSAVVIFDAALPARTIAERNWNTPDLHAGVDAALQASTQGPLRIPDQTIAGGAYLRIQLGAHHYCRVRDARSKGVTYDALWLWPCAPS